MAFHREGRPTDHVLPDTDAKKNEAAGPRSTAFALTGLVNWKIPPHLESVVEVNRDQAEVWGRRRDSVDKSTMRLRFGQLKGTPLKDKRFYRLHAGPAAPADAAHGPRFPRLKHRPPEATLQSLPATHWPRAPRWGWPKYTVWRPPAFAASCHRAGQPADHTTDPPPRCHLR